MFILMLHMAVFHRWICLLKDLIKVLRGNISKVFVADTCCIVDQDIDVFSECFYRLVDNLLRGIDLAKVALNAYASGVCLRLH